MKPLRAASVACAFLSLLPAGASGANSAEPKRSPEEIFAYLDSDADGKLTLSEFEGLGEAIPYFKEHPEAVPGIFKKFDANGDGALSLEEFRGFMTRRVPNATAPKPEPTKPPAAASAPVKAPPANAPAIDARALIAAAPPYCRRRPARNPI